MSDKKISELTASTTPLAGTEVLPIVQANITKKTSVESVLTSVQPSGVVDAIAYLNATKQLTYNAKYTFNGSVQTVLNPTYVNGGYVSARDSFSGGVYNTFDFVEGSTTTGYLRNYGSVFGAGLNNQIHLWNTQDAHVVVGVNNAIAGSFTTNGLAFPSGKGIDFSATAGTGTSELFDDYEEGTWTPVIAAVIGSLTSYTIASCLYTKVGRSVLLTGVINIITNGSASAGLFVTGLPFVGANVNFGCGVGRDAGVTGKTISLSPSGTNDRFVIYAADATHPGADGAILNFQITYTAI